MDELFYKNQEQITDIINRFAGEILPKKTASSAFYSKYRVFSYKEELARIEFGYQPQQTDDFIKEYADLFENTLNFDNPGVMYNIIPNPNVYGQAASFFASLANANICTDMIGGKLVVTEQAVIQYLNELIGWDATRAGGIFTFGGKGTLLYALKVALSKFDPASRRKGIHGDNYVFSNDMSHPSHVEVCNWLGVGEDRCIRLPTKNDATLDVAAFKKTFIAIIKKGGRVPLIFLNGMTTEHHSFDDFKVISEMCDYIVTQYSLTYTPHIHVDSVLGWVYLLLTRYDFAANPLNIPPTVKKLLQHKVTQAQAMKYADSFSADFHKTGFCSYISSAFLLREKTALYGIQGSYTESDDLSFSEYTPYNFALESSRSPHGPVAAFATLKTLGVEGFTQILADHTEACLYLKHAFNKQSNVTVCNYDEESNLLFLAFKPPVHQALPLDDATSDTIAAEIRSFNIGFYSFVLDKSTREAMDITFSCSRTYLYHGKAYGCIKLYPFSSHFDKAAAKKIYKRINQLFEEYLHAETSTQPYAFLDYAMLKGK